MILQNIIGWDYLFEGAMSHIGDNFSVSKDWIKKIWTLLGCRPNQAEKWLKASTVQHGKGKFHPPEPEK